MVAIGFGVVLLGYWLGLTGYSLVRGYDNRPVDLISPFFHGKWSTTLYTGTAIFPGGTSSASQASQGGTASSSPGTKRVNQAAGQAGRPLPGSVQGRL